MATSNLAGSPQQCRGGSACKREVGDSARGGVRDSVGGTVSEGGIHRTR